MKFISKRANLGRDVKIGIGSIIKDDALIGDGVTIGHYAIIYENVTVGDDSFIGNHVVLGEMNPSYYKDPKSYINPPLRIGSNSIVRTGSIIYAGTEIGNRLHTGSYTVIRDSCHLGDNNLVGSFSELYPDVLMGKCNRLASWVLLAPKTILHNYVWFLPYAGTTSDLHPPCGRCVKGPTIKDYAIIGTGALLFPKITVEKNSIVGVGSVVTKDVPANTVVMGVPARHVGDVRSIKCKKDLVKAPYPWKRSISREKAQKYGYER